MGWAVGYDTTWQRDIGYGVPAKCDHPDCDEDIDRGLSYVCGGEPFGGEHGCGLYFCSKHLYIVDVNVGANEPKCVQLCKQCMEERDWFAPKPDVPLWINHKLIDPSWAEWRRENRAFVRKHDTWKTFFVRLFKRWRPSWGH